MEVIEVCVSVSQIQLHPRDPPRHFRSDAVQQELEAIASRQRELARFVANPRAYPCGDELVALMSQFDYSPTGRYMLACCFPDVPFFFKINQCTDSATETAEYQWSS